VHWLILIVVLESISASKVSTQPPETRAVTKSLTHWAKFCSGDFQDVTSRWYLTAAARMFNQIEREAAMAVFWLRVMTSTATVVKTLRLVCHRIRVVLHWWLWRSNAMPDDMEREVTSGEKQFCPRGLGG